jgi:tetratricopeptide (TPR) repeat protein
VNIYIACDSYEFDMTFKITILSVISVLIIVGCIGHAIADDCGCDDSGSGGNSGGNSIDSGGGGSSSDSSSSSSSGGDSSDYGLTWRMKGDDFYNKGLYNASLDAYEKAVSYDPYAIKAWTGLGRVYLNLGDPAQAIVADKVAVKLDPSDPDLYVLLGDAYTANSNYKDAISSYQKAQLMKPTITGVVEKIVIAETGQTGINMTNSTAHNVSALSETTEPAILLTELPSITMTETIQPATTPKAAFPGIIAIISVLIIGLVYSFKRK